MNKEASAMLLIMGPGHRSHLVPVYANDHLFNVYTAHDGLKGVKGTWMCVCFALTDAEVAAYQASMHSTTGVLPPLDAFAAAIQCTIEDNKNCDLHLGPLTSDGTLNFEYPAYTIT